MSLGLGAGASLWDRPCATRQPLHLFRRMDLELCKCLQAVRSDPRFSFHVHYFSVPHCLGHTENDRGMLWFVGSLRGWRPGLQTWHQTAIAEDTAPVFSIHFFPRAGDGNVHPRCTLPHRTPSGGDSAAVTALFDSGMYDLVAVQGCDPSRMLRRCGAASLSNSSCSLLTWLLLVHWKLLLGQAAYCVSGTFRSSGEFCLTSALFGGTEDELPMLEAWTAHNCSMGGSRVGAVPCPN